MRFLQTEWHRHERDRNSWEIERAEMKARIAQLEGDHKTSKRMLQGSEARIKMLEIALKRERWVFYISIFGTNTDDGVRAEA